MRQDSECASKLLSGGLWRKAVSSLFSLWALDTLCAWRRYWKQGNAVTQLAHMYESIFTMT